MAQVQTHTEAGEMTQIFVEFVMLQAQNAAYCLGQIPNARGEAEVNLPYAKILIDQLVTIRAKTQGNLNAEEKKIIDQAVSELQLGYVEVARLVRAQNLGMEIPPPPLRGDLPEETAPLPIAPSPSPVPAAPAPDAATPPPTSATSAPAVSTPPPEPPPEEGRKKFSKSYGS